MFLLQGVRSQAASERQALGNLAAGTALVLEPGASYFLLPRWWLAAWRAYLQARDFASGKQTGRNGAWRGP